ncbi:MAG: hypothetical protein OQK82_05005 [Candidatus Pacearchaeota archaeon]|nr:hypothetical protein [Candidatus Pacearchaeota archaeon]
MKIKIKGEMPIEDIIKAIIEKLKEVEDDLAIHHSKGAILYINPTNGFGEQVVPHNRAGREVDNLYSNGPYRSIADDYKM